jgi:hypothetical protein
MILNIIGIMASIDKIKNNVFLPFVYSSLVENVNSVPDINDKIIEIKPFSGGNSVDSAKEIIINQIDKDIPIPFLLLKHKNKKIKELIWHWFLIIGYEEIDDDLLIKIVTYGKYQCISLNNLWNTGYDKKGGMIIIDFRQ